MLCISLIIPKSKKQKHKLTSSRGLEMKRLITLSMIATLSCAEGWSEQISELTQDAKELWSEQTTAILSQDNKENNQTKSYKELRKEHFDTIWEDVIKNLESGLIIHQQMQVAPNYTLFGEDKKSLRKKFDMVLDQIINLLLDDNLLNYRKKIRQAHTDISTMQKEILKYRERKIVAPTESHLKTTKAQFDEKIKESKDRIASQKENIINTKLAMSQNFRDLGITLSLEQIDVLLARVDGDDIIQMTLVMDVLKQITQQLLGIMQESNEELHQAKKYYGMHMVLLDLVVYIQDNFISHIEMDYIPQIDKIISHTKEMLVKTSKKISQEQNLNRRNIYYQNYESQHLTLKTAIIYRQNLVDELTQVKKAKNVSRKNLELSKNTYETVALSSDLFKIIAGSQEMMQAVMKLQIPAIIPFENIQMKQKYEELTKKIQK